MKLRRGRVLAVVAVLGVLVLAGIPMAAAQGSSHPRHGSSFGGTSSASFHQRVGVSSEDALLAIALARHGLFVDPFDRHARFRTVALGDGLSTGFGFPLGGVSHRIARTGVVHRDVDLHPNVVLAALALDNTGSGFDDSGLGGGFDGLGLGFDRLGFDGLGFGLEGAGDIGLHDGLLDWPFGF